MKCQKCDKPATEHITDLEDGKLIAEYHVCDEHVNDLSQLGPLPRPSLANLADEDLQQALSDGDARNELLGRIIPPLTLCLTDRSPEVRFQAAYQLIILG